MAYTKAQTDAISEACGKIRLRNWQEIDAFKEIVENHASWLEGIRHLRRRYDERNLEILQLQNSKGNLTAALRSKEQTLLKAPELITLQDKVANLQQDLSQSYLARAEISQQLVVATQGLQTTKEENECFSRRAVELEEQIMALQDRAKYDEEMAVLKNAAVEAAGNEAQRRREEADTLSKRNQELEEENRMLIDRWMQLKMQDAERINEANAIYEDMMQQTKSRRLAELASRQVDGVVRQSEHGADMYVDVGLPGKALRTIQGHEGGCCALGFDLVGQVLVSGGQDRTVRVWDTNRGNERTQLRGCLGTVLDVAVIPDGSMAIGSGSDHKLYLWILETARVRHTLTGHTEKVVAVDIERANPKRAASAAHDRTMKVWDLERGFAVTTIVCYSNCNSLRINVEGSTISSGHMDGSLRIWDMRSGKLANEVAAHAQGISSVSVSYSGHSILTTGRDNVLQLFDGRTLEARASFRAPGFRVATNWSRACLSPDERFLAAGSTDGCVYVWSEHSKALEATLQGHNCSVITSAWSDSGNILATADKLGNIIFWH